MQTSFFPNHLYRFLAMKSYTLFLIKGGIIRKTLIKFDDVMNDQRQVIFSQRLKILKENNITGASFD